MAKVKAHMPDIYKEMKEILDEFGSDLDEAKERGLNNAADYITQKYAENTPTDTGATKQSWVATKKYKNVKYINNTHLTKTNIPVANLVEFSKNGKPFIRRTFEAEKENMFNIIKEELK